jgi:undecaprenyl diphosphate synthase
MTLVMCVNYGGRAELTDAARAIAGDVAAGKLKPREVNEKVVENYLDEPGLPDVDLFLRPSGEQRISNFLLWQSAYAEMVYQDVLFPDYTRADLKDAVYEYARRDRRFGGVK